jgi:hypothetical protein
MLRVVSFKRPDKLHGTNFLGSLVGSLSRAGRGGGLVHKRGWTHDAVALPES